MAGLAWFLSLVLLPQSRPAPDLREVFTFAVGGAPAHSVAWSPDGQWLAAGGQEGDVRLWRAADRTLAATLTASDQWIGALAFRADSARLAVLGRDLSVWDVARQKLLTRLPAMGPHGLAWSGDGARLAFSPGPGQVTVVDGQDFTVVRQCTWSGGSTVRALCFTPDGRSLLVGDEGPKVVEFDLASGARSVRLALTTADDVAALALLPDQRLVVLFASGRWRIGARDGALPRPATGLAVSGDGRRVVMSGADGRLWSCDDQGAVLAELDGGTAWVPAVAMAPDGTLASAGNDGRVLVWRDGRIATELGGLVERPHGIAFSGDERFAVATGRDTVTVDLASFQLRRYPGGGFLVSGAAGPEVIVVEPQRVRVASVQGMTELFTVPLPEPGERHSAALSPDGHVLVVGGGMMGNNLLVDLTAREARILTRDFYQFVDIDFSADSTRFAAAAVSGNHGESGRLDLWSVQGEKLHSQRGRGPLETVAFDRGGARLWWSESSATRPGVPAPRGAGVHVLDTTSLVEGPRPAAQARWLRCIDPDLAVSHDFGTVTLWRLPQLTPLRTLSGFDAYSAVLSRSGRWVLVAGRTAVRILRVTR